MVILAGLVAGCRHLAGRGRWVLLESGGGMVTGLVGAYMGPSIKQVPPVAQVCCYECT